jgi:catechol 2,3-dioxygenase-like lactoylglutathione lyase family enzyme
LLTEIQQAPDGRKHFYLKDPYNNIFEIIEGTSWFMSGKEATGGVGGCVIGVSNIDNALRLYRDVLGYGEVLSDQTGKFNDLKGMPGGEDTFRRVLLRANKHKRGAFSRLLGVTELELVEVKDRTPKKIFDNRYWGDLGYIHICFDINGMVNLANTCGAAGFNFTVDSRNSFDMGKASGHFSYCEDPDGTLIEFVETHKIPIFEKIGWYLSLKKRNPEIGNLNFQDSNFKVNKLLHFKLTAAHLVIIAVDFKLIGTGSII